MILNKAASQNKKMKKRKERRNKQSPMALHWTENCLALATICTTSHALIPMLDQILLFSSL